MMHFLFLAVAKFSTGEERRQSAFTIFYHYLFLNKLIEKKILFAFFEKFSNLLMELKNLECQ